MNKLLQLHFSHHGPFGQEMADALLGLAESINDEPGFLWKIWTENSETQEGGGIYLFESEETALTYLAMHTERLTQFGVKEVHSRLFDVNEPLTQINRGAIS